MDGLSRLFLPDGGAAAPGGGRGVAPHPAAAGTGAGAGRVGHGYLESPRVVDIARALNAAVAQLEVAARGSMAGKVVLVLDQPDVLLAAAAADEDGATSMALRDVVLDLREVSFSPRMLAI